MELYEAVRGNQVFVVLLRILEGAHHRVGDCEGHFPADGGKAPVTTGFQKQLVGAVE